ncbi:EFR1 family ferrodoxin [Anaeromicropila herbilytica]|uniref:Ferredoxin n=1 Tax=Anaeromicropila herbilytica TaxID=2785025 RepID=A0A7R7EPP9_9FIRM|nr:EFR1 family ferrodoxin [Anaeromicropila herbilytica]BCN32712.1 (Fe-S)-binding protein [Anaeromicropila herbilytica]
MKALILYFSGTGNTEYVAKKIGSIMNDSGIKSEVHSIEEKYKINPNAFDLLILGCPKYYEYPVLDFIGYLKKKLPKSDKIIPTMVFCTQAAYLETDFGKIERILKRKNYKVTVTKSFQIANNMVIFKAFPLTDKEKIQANLEKLNRELEPLVQEFLNGKEMKESPRIFFRVVSHLSGVVFTKLFPIFGMKYSVSKQCTGCGACAKKCPRKNIIMQGGKPRFGRKCLFCMRCINICPKNAILYKKRVCEQYKRLK